MNGNKRPPLDEQKSLWEATVAAEGVTTGAGAADGKSIVDAVLAGSGVNSFFSMLMVLYPGQPRLVDSMDITGFTNGTGEVIFSTAYKGVAAAIPAGVPYKIVTFRFVPAEVAALAASLGLMADAATADDLSDVTTTSVQAKLRRLLLRLSGAGIFSADIQGAARTELDTMLAQLATYFKAAGAAYSATVGGAAQADVEASLTALAAYFNAASAALSVVSQPGVAARTNLNAILTDLADILAGGAGITNFPAAAVPADGVSFAEVLRQIYNDVIAVGGAAVLHEQADVPFSVNAALAEANIFDLSVANTRYVVRSLRVKCVDPGVQTVTVRLYELVNNALTLVDSFAIDATNWTTNHSLMDMFGLPNLAGDNLKVAVIATAAGPYACTGQYCVATAGV